MLFSPPGGSLKWHLIVSSNSSVSYSLSYWLFGFRRQDGEYFKTGSKLEAVNFFWLNFFLLFLHYCMLRKEENPWQNEKYSLFFHFTFIFFTKTVPITGTQDFSLRIRQYHSTVGKLLPHLIMSLILLSFDILFTISAHLRVIIPGNAYFTAPIHSKLLLKCMKNTPERLHLNVCTAIPPSQSLAGAVK